MENNAPETQCGIETDPLSPEEFLSLKTEIRQCWRMLGMIHLRMHNDMELKTRKKTSRLEIYKRLEEVSRRLNDMMDTYFPMDET